jgi:hypothetical protein
MHDIHRCSVGVVKGLWRQLEDDLCSELGLCIEDLLGKKRFLNRALVNIHYFVLLEELINQKHKEKGLICQLHQDWIFDVHFKYDGSAKTGQYILST